MKPQKILKAEVILKKNKAVGIILPDFKLDYIIIILKTVYGTGIKINQWNRIKSTEINPRIYS